MTKDVWRNDAAKRHIQYPYQSSGQIVCQPTRRVALSVLMICLFITVSVWADYQKGAEAYERGDYKTALQEWRPFAESGDPQAQFRLGLMYENGWGVNQDGEEAVKWFRRASKQGHARAEQHLAAMVGIDLKGIAQLLRAGAELGYATSQNNLGSMYRRGYSVPQDYKEAVKWFRKAAEQGDAPAQNNLGSMYRNGYGVPQDYKEAVKWFRKPAERGDPMGQFELGVMYANGKGVPQDYGEAIKWYRKAVEQENASAQNNLGTMYENGKGVSQDYVTAHVWYNLAGAQGDKKARENRDRIAEKMTPAQLTEAQRLAREWKPTTEDK